MLPVLSSVVGDVLFAAPQDPPVAEKVRIEGIVVGLDRLPAANGEVWIGDDVPERARMHTDATGRFVLRAPIARSTMVRARLPGMGLGAGWVGLLQLQSPVRVQLWPTRTVRGVVRTADGAAVAGAFVSVVPDHLYLPTVPAVTTTAADGTFVLGEVLPGAASVRAGKPGLGSTVVALAAEETQVALEIDADEQRTLTVRLDAPADQLALAMLHVDALRDEAYVPLAAAFSSIAFAGKDTIVLKGLPARARMHVTVSLPGSVTTPWSEAMPLGVRSWEIAFAPAPAVQMRGRVVDATGKGCGDLLLAAIPAGDDDPVGLQRPTLARTAADGSFTIAAPVPVGKSAALVALSNDWRLSSTSGGYQCLLPVGAEVASRVVAEPTLRLCGRVLDASGMPVIGAEVWGSRGWQVHACTDHEGRFEMIDVTSDVERLASINVVEAAGYVAASRVVSGSGRFDLGDFRLEPGGTLEGLAKDDAGKPVPGACVWISGQPAFSRTVVADSSGHFEMRGLPSTRLGLASSKSGVIDVYSIQFENVDVVAGQTVRHDVIVR